MPHQHASTPARQHASTPARQHASTPARQHAKFSPDFGVSGRFLILFSSDMHPQPFVAAGAFFLFFSFKEVA
jgi:hypothetical protein